MRHKKPENFLLALKRNGHAIAEEAMLLPTEAADEALVMGLRLKEGIDAEALAKRFGLPAIVDWQKVDPLVELGLLRSDGAHIAVTAKGRLLLDRLIAEIAVAEPTASAGARKRASLALPESAIVPAAAVC